MFPYRAILVTGGAGFVGSNLALLLKRELQNARVIAFDNLRRRGSELSLGRLREGGVEFVHGDVRNPEDVAAAGPFELLLDCSAEPSVHAGYGESPEYLLQTNLVGTIHCLEQARRHRADVIFLSSSRVYPIQGLRDLPLVIEGERFAIAPGRSGPGWSEAGIALDFPMDGSRSLYGTTKLASEMLVEEYRAMYGLRTVINRCGVITGPWQMGKVDQGFVVLWAARHLYGGPLTYSGFGGKGYQVRDLLHVEDLFELIRIQLGDLGGLSGQTFNVGGGAGISVSLAELTEHCRARAGRQISIGADPVTREADVPYYVADNRAAMEATTWQPVRAVDRILDEVFAWLAENRRELEPILGA